MTIYDLGPLTVFEGFGGIRPGINADESGFSVLVYGAAGDDCGIHGKTPEQAMAYARLFCASPDLLEAVENYLYGRKDARECEAEMRAAVAKVNGGG